MKSEEFIELKNKLGDKGYRYTNAILGADYSYYKPFGKYSNPYDDEGRPCYQIFFEVWDFTRYNDPHRQYGVDVMVDVSRTVEESVGLRIPYKGQPISYFENKAESFYQWVIKNFEIEKHV